MALTTAQQIIWRAKDALNLPRTSVKYSDAFLCDLLNEAIQIIAADGLVAHGESAISIGPSTRTYGLPQGTQYVELAFLDDDQVGLAKFSKDEIAKSGGIQTQGRPTHYLQENESITLWPAPDADYTLYVTATGTPELVTTVTDYIYLTDLYVAALKYWLVSACLKREDDPRWESEFSLYNAMIEKAKGVDANRRADSFGGVTRDVFDSTDPVAGLILGRTII